MALSSAAKGTTNMANGEYDYLIPSLKDSVLFTRSLEAIQEAKEDGKVRYETGSFIVISGQQYQYTLVQREGVSMLVMRNSDVEREASEMTSMLEALDGRYIESMNIRLLDVAGNNPSNVITITITRQELSARDTLKIKLSGIFRQIENLPLSKSLVEKFEPCDPVETAFPQATDEPSLYIQAYDEQMQRLTNLNLEQTEKVTTALRNQAAENTKALTEERVALQADYDSKRTALTSREEELDEKEKSLDLADAKSSRRGLRERMAIDLGKKMSSFNYSKQTNSARWAFLGLLCTGIVVTGFFAYTSLQAIAAAIVAGDSIIEGNPTNVYMMFLVIKGSVSTLAFGALLIYLLKWQSAWVQQRKNDEDVLMRLGLDLDRASWVVESLVEFKDEKIEEFPEPLLNAVTRNLFKHPGKSETITTPVDDVAGILRNGAESIKLKLGDHEVVLDRKGLKKMTAKEKSEPTQP